MRLCKDCKHSDKILTSLWCRHPSVGVNPTSGDLYSATCFTERHAHMGKRTACGPEAKLWEPEAKLTLIQKLKSLFK